MPTVFLFLHSTTKTPELEKERQPLDSRFDSLSRWRCVWLCPRQRKLGSPQKMEIPNRYNRRMVRS